MDNTLTSPPNIVLIMCDQMRHDAAGFAGSHIVKTPNLDLLAASGVCFENAYCASPVCSPARASWLTGLYPHAHLQLKNYGPKKAGKFGCYLPHDRITIADILKRAGYRCGIVGPWHLGDDHRPQHGFTDFWCTYRYQGDYPDKLFDYFDTEGVDNLYLSNAAGMTKYGNTLEFGSITDPRQQRTTWTMDRSIEFVEQQDDDTPFFLFASIKDPHPRILVPPQLLSHYQEDDMLISPSFRDPLDGKPKFQLRGKFRIPSSVTESEFQRMMTYYYALITHIDNQVGRLLNTLEGTNTIVAFISDHGELLGDHGFTEKCLMYEGSVRVPCLLSWKNHLPSDFRVTTPLAGVDLMPTLLSFAGLQPDTPIDGRSVAEDIMNGQQPVDQPIFAEIASLDAIYFNADEPEQLAAHIMIVDGQWKYISNRFNIDELYDLKSDPDEMHNVVDQSEHQERIDQMRKQIATMVGRTGPGPYEWVLK
ncbi:sulfatase-like hydrolase/transferase [Candidatus Poribacteria bacterium]|nr:sulfatase-like hydrolase/transferase [Candidatus Poribacteria bacterium]